MAHPQIRSDLSFGFNTLTLLVPKHDAKLADETSRSNPRATDHYSF